MKSKLLILIVLLMPFMVHTAQDKPAQLTNLPTFYISTVDEKKIVSKTDYINAFLEIVSSDASEEFADSTEIRGRGNSTWGMPKKPYRLKLYEKYSLLNRPAREKSWVLLANYADKTLMRHAVAFKISELVGLHFTPTARFVDVVLNGKYQGNYMMSDQMEVAAGRVEVEAQKVTDTSEPAITGGYLLEIDGFASAEPMHFYTGKGMPITVKYPKKDKINEAQFNYIRNFISDFETRLFNKDFTDPVNGYRARIDEHTLINWYIASELTGNSDAFWSTYIYKKRGEPKIYFGPMWDYDIAFNNDNRLGDATRKLMREYGHTNRTWIVRLWEDPWFRGEVRKRWKMLVDSGIEHSIKEYISELENTLQESQKLNYELWPDLSNRVYLEVFTFDTYEEGVDYLHSYIHNRIDFLNNGFIADGQDPVFPPFVADENAWYNIINRKNGFAVDINDNETELMLSEIESGRKSQHWRFVDLGNGYFHIVSRSSAKAMRSPVELGATVLLGDPGNYNRLEWEVRSANLKDFYGIISRSSGFLLNNQGGSMENNNPLIEWNSNLNTSDNARFEIVKVDHMGTGVDQHRPDEIINIRYNRNTQTLSLLAGDQFGGSMILSVYSVSGSEILRTDSFAVNDQLDVSSLKTGVYLVRLQTTTGNYTMKFIKQ